MHRLARLIVVGAVSSVVAQAWAMEEPVPVAPTAEPNEAPGDAPVAEPKQDEFVSPADLFKKIREQRNQRKSRQDEKDSKIQVATFVFNGGLAERPPEFDLFGTGDSSTLNGVLDRFEKAATDDTIKAVYIRLSTQASMQMNHVNELGSRIKQIRDAGKPVFVYADTFDTTTYMLAAHASDVALMSGGDLFMPGIAIETMFFRGVFDKVGVIGDFVQVGEFKGASEPYLNTEPSPELRQELETLTRGLYDEVVNTVATARGKDASAVKEMIDAAMHTADDAKAAGFVDHVVADQEDVKKLIEARLGGEVNLDTSFGAAEERTIDFSNPFALLASMARPAPQTDEDKIAIVYALGTIVDGDGEAGLLGGGGVGSDRIRRVLRQAERDDTVKAIVLRIDSPGGSALASEAMWQALRRVNASKPVIVSVGGMAASGGYYLASASDTIVADPTAIVGSIGVVGGKFVLGGLFEKVGLTTAEFAQGANANLFSTSKPWTESQRAMIRRSMENVYKQFTDRIMSTRAGKIQDIDQVARGRIFTARRALELGMIDQLGGIDDAIVLAAERVGLEEGDFELLTLPPPPTLADMLRGGGGFGLSAPAMSSDMRVQATLDLMPAELRASLVQQLQLAKMLQRRPVAVMSPFVITVR
jgi:protease-4